MDVPSPGASASANAGSASSDLDEQTQTCEEAMAESCKNRFGSCQARFLHQCASHHANLAINVHPGLLGLCLASAWRTG